MANILWTSEVVVVGTTGVVAAAFVAVSRRLKLKAGITSAAVALLFFVGFGIALYQRYSSVSLIDIIISALLSTIAGSASYVGLMLGRKLAEWLKKRNG